MKARVVGAEVSDDGNTGIVTIRLGDGPSGARIALNGPVSTIESLGKSGFIGAEIDLELRLVLGEKWAVFK